MAAAVVRQGVRRILLLAAFEADQIREFATKAGERFKVPMHVIEEPERAGTGGALWNAREFLDERFMLMNGDSLFDVLLADAALRLEASSDAIGVLALREVDDTSRFGVVEMDGGAITSFSARPVRGGAGLVNGGVYAFRKEIVAYLRPKCSLEADVLADLAPSRRLLGLRTRDFFIDIGVPESYTMAQSEIPSRLTRPAVFFDRDGVLNVDHGHVGRPDQFEWQPGAREAVRAVNAAGYLAFIVTNQAGIARDALHRADFKDLTSHMQADLFGSGAHIDDIRYCPHHPEATLDKWRKACDWRKPGPGMVLDLLLHWDVDRSASFVIGNKESDLVAAWAARLPGFLFKGGSLLDFLRQNTSFKDRVDHDH